MKKNRTTILRALVLLLVAGCLVCASCSSSSPQMYKHKRNTDCGC